MLCLSFFFSEFVLAREKKKRKLMIKEIKREKKISLQEAQLLSQREIMIENPLEEELINVIDRTLVKLTNMADRLKLKSLARSKIINKVINLALEQASYVTNQEHKSFDKVWSAWYEGGKKGKEPIFSSVDSKKYYQIAVDYATIFMKEYPKNKNTVFVYFQKAVSLQYLDKYIQAINVFEDIIAKYPDNPVASDAFFEVGSYYFDRDKFPLAKEYFFSVLNFKKANRVDWAHYKLGWIYFNFGNYVKCLQHWKKTVDLTIVKEKKTKIDNLLKKQVLRDMIYAFAELGTIKEAVQYYKQKGKKENISRLLFYLGQTYFEQGKRRKAEKAYLQLLKKLPHAKEAVKAQSELALISYEKKQYDDLWARLIFWHKNYGIDSQWAKKNDEEDVKEAIIRVEETMLYYAQKLQLKADQTKVGTKKIGEYKELSKKALYLQAEKGYNYYIQLYPNSIRLPEVFEYLGDITYAMGMYRKSAIYYEAIVRLPKEKSFIYDNTGKPTENIHYRSATNMLDSMSKYFSPYYTKLIEKNPNFKKKPDKISKSASDFIRSCRLFLKYYAKDVALKKECDLFISEIFYRTGDKIKAKKYLKILALNYKSSKEGALAVDKLIPLYSDNPDEQLKLAKELLQIPQYSKSSVGSKLRLLIRSIELNKIASKDNLVLRAELYEQYALDHQNDKEIELLWYNAATAYFSANDIENAIRILSFMVKKFPKFEKRKSIILQLAQLYETMFLFSKALDNYLIYVKLYPNDENTKASFQRACSLSYMVKHQNLITICSSFVKKYKDITKNVIFSLLESSFYAKNAELYTQIMYSIYFKYYKLTVDEKISVLYRLYQIHGRNGQTSTSLRKQIMKLGSSSGLSGESLRYYANFHYQDVRLKVKKIKLFKLPNTTLPELQKTIQINFELLKKAELLYARILNLKDGYSTIKVFYDLALFYKGLHNLLSNPSPVKGFTKEQIFAQLKPTQDAIYKQFYNYLVNANSIAKTYKIYDEYVVNIHNTLSKFNAKLNLFGAWVPAISYVSLDVEIMFAKNLLLNKE